MKTKAVIAVLGLAAAAFALPASAQMRMSSAYAGFGLGQSKFKDACSGISGCDDKDTAFKIFGGYQFNPNIAAELGYNDLGKASGGGAEIKATAWELSALGAFPVANQISILGRLGVYHGELKPSGIPGVSSETNNGITFGFGGQFDLNRNIGLRVEWQRFNKMGGGNFEKSNVDVLGISGLYRFQ
jgi:OOP family OmpA-OmpF porin